MASNPKRDILGQERSAEEEQRAAREKLAQLKAQEEADRRAREEQERRRREQAEADRRRREYEAQKRREREEAERREQEERERQARFERELERARQRKEAKKLNAIFVFSIIISVVMGVLAVASYFTPQMLIAFKICLVFHIVAAVVFFLLMGNDVGKRNSDAVAWTYLLLVAIHIFGATMLISEGRFKVDKIVTDDNGCVYEVVDGECYLYSCGKDMSEIVISELSDNIVGFSTAGLKEKDAVKSIVIDVPNFTIGRKALANCEKLTSVTITGSDCVIKAKAFMKCEKLEYVMLQDGTYTLKGGSLFADCVKLHNIYFKNGTIKQATNTTLKGLNDVAVHLDNVSAEMHLGGSEKLTLVVYHGTTGIGTTKPDVLVFQNGFDFKSWTDTRHSGDIAPPAPVIYLPTSVTSIPGRLFGSDSTAYHVYYQGSEGDWSNVDVQETDGWIFGSNSNYGRDLTIIHYNSTNKYWEQSTVEGN